MRILCLHGRGTNSDIFERQLEIKAPSKSRASHHRLIYIDYAFDFLDGEAEVNPAPGIEGLLPGPYLAWHRRHFAPEVARAHDLVRQALEEDGPYDGIIGFSQGAAMAASLILSSSKPSSSAAAHEAVGGLQPPFRFAVFICSVLPVAPPPPPPPEAGQQGSVVDGTAPMLAYEHEHARFLGLSDEELRRGAPPGPQGVVHLYSGCEPLLRTTGGSTAKAAAIMPLPPLRRRWWTFPRSTSGARTTSSPISPSTWPLCARRARRRRWSTSAVMTFRARGRRSI
ncbi:uncharacterized protein PG986_013871 [Apiospora aurea]|uniref:Serine hydrolase domain-containing protein n=1 Tax=Apiospora aurea TaxID=335848 RepID=A0ABR1PWU5_9PEZI